MKKHVRNYVKFLLKLDKSFSTSTNPKQRVRQMLAGIFIAESPRQLYQTWGKEKIAKEAVLFYMGSLKHWPSMKRDYDREAIFGSVSVL